MKNILLLSVCFVPLAALATQVIPANAQTSATQISVAESPQAQFNFDASDRALLLSLLDRSRPFGDRDRADQISAQFDKAWIAPTLEIFNFIADPTLRKHLLKELRAETGEDFGTDMNRWFRWMWNEDAVNAVGYDQFKADFYELIDPRFGTYFEGRADTARIRLDEVRWGGVRQDGIPPLRDPKMLTVADAEYLDDDDVIFGIEVNGDFRAYPKRILAWHEMATDTVGGEDVILVYCTLCGTVILYDAVYDGVKHDIGTSGFLNRSNKLMYDKATQSLWNTLTGEPVVGPLADSGIALDYRSVVTTKWGKWKTLHPDTQVLSLETGHRRDYAEGVAYHDYFATDDLMFNTPFQDSRLANKQEVLALRFKGQPGSLAIDTTYLENNPVYSGEIGTQRFVVITDETGANRVYDPGDVVLTKTDGSIVKDKTGQAWKISEARLTASDGRELKRLPYHRAFWFGWQAAYPSTELVK